MERGQQFSVVVLDGMHAGATAALNADGITIVGSVDDCDIRLFDPGIKPHHFAFSLRGEDFLVRTMEGECSLNGSTLKIGESATVAGNTRVSLGDTGVCLTVQEKASVPPDECVTTTRNTRAWFSPAGLPAVALVLILIAAFGRGAGDNSATDPVDEVNQLLNTLSAESYVTVEVDASRVTLRGVLPDEVYAQLESSLAISPQDVVNLTLPTARLLEQVRSVFRTNGYHVELDYAGDGKIQISNLDSSNPLIQQVVARARNDVKALVEIEFLPSPSTAPADGLRLFSSDPDKRLTTIVDGDTAYIATTDGGRYFVGSMLPGGYVLRQISDDGIQVDDNGELRWFTL